MPPIPPPTSVSFQAFRNRVLAPLFIDDLARQVAVPRDELLTMSTQSLAEAEQTLRVLAGLVPAEGSRIIEIGAGLGLTSSYLAGCGFDVTALEPGGIGFEHYPTVAAEIALLLGAEYRALSISAEDLRRETHGAFALIYSNNVIEHVGSPVDVFRSLCSVLDEGGMMVHSCPNYFIPYEPHFGLPLVPGRPKWTARILPASVRASGLWASLNFIRARDVSAIAAELALSVRFRPAALATSLERLETDTEFRGRHRVLFSIEKGMSRIGLVRLLQKLPPRWSTPMEFIMWRATPTDDWGVAQWLGRGASDSNTS